VEREAFLNLRPGAMSPMNATIDYQRFATSIAMNASSPPITRVSDDGMYITYGEKTLSITKWRSGLRKLADEVTQELDDLCMSNMFGLSIPDNIFDDWGNEDRGYSWTKNGQFTDDKRSLLGAMLKDPVMRLAKVNKDGEFKFNIAEVWDFLNKCDAVNQKLALLSFFTAGQTPRVSEFVEHKFSNSTRPRTIFRDYHSLWLATRRVKTESRLEKETFIPMKCHPELTNLLDRYLLIVRPVEAELVKVVRTPQHYHTFTEYMWTKNCERISPEAMRKAILEFTTKYFDSPIGTQDYRQICVEIGRVFLGSEFEIREEDLDTLATQAGHSIIMSRLRYAPEVGMPPSMSSDLLGRFARVSEAWWQVTGFKPGHAPLLPLRARQDLRAGSSNPSLPSSSTSTQAPVFDTQSIILAITSAVTAEIQKVEHRLEAQVRKAVAEAMIQSQYSIGQPRHAPHPVRTAIPQPPLPPIEDVLMDEELPPTVPAPLLNEDEEMTDLYGLTSDHPDADQNHFADPFISHRAALPVQARNDNTPDILKTLLARHFPHIPSPSFKSSYQAEAVRLAVEHQESFVAILPTGGGKSLTYTLPAFNPKEDGYRSYIIIPNRALLQDQIERAKAIGLQTHQWTAKNSQVDAGVQLVFLALESATSQTFKR
jgi:DEAD/DEAH box helicase